MTFPLSDPIPLELKGHTEPGRRRGRRAAPLTPQDYENIAKCKKMSGEQWLKDPRVGGPHGIAGTVAVRHFPDTRWICCERMGSRTIPQTGEAGRRHP